MIAGGVCGCRAVCVVAGRGMHGCGGVCMVAGGMCDCRGVCVVAGGMCGCGGVCIGYDKIRSMSGRYASYWNAVLFQTNSFIQAFSYMRLIHVRF